MFIYKSKPTKELGQFFEMKDLRVKGVRMLEMVSLIHKETENAKGMTKNR